MLDVEANELETYRTGRDLVHVPLLGCPRCGHEVEVGSLRQDTLFRGGGYGGTRRVETLGCPACSWSRIVAVATERPPRDG